MRNAPVKALAASLPAKAWRSVTWQHADNPRRTARCAAVRVTPANDWPHGHLLPEVWLLCERPDGTTDEKYYLINLPATTSLTRLVTFMHQRWAIEQQYQQLKTELGVDHFEGRTYPGWNRHVAVSAVAYGFLQCERRRRLPDLVSFETIRALVQDVFLCLLFAARPKYAVWVGQLRELLPLRL